MVITNEVANFVVMNTLVDQDSSIDILSWKSFKKLGLSEETMVPMEEQIVGFLGERVNTKGSLTCTRGSEKETENVNLSRSDI